MCRCGAQGHGFTVDLAVLTVALDDVKVLFQPKRFYDKITFLFPEGAVSKFSVQYAMFCGASHFLVNSLFPDISRDRTPMNAVLFILHVQTQP